METNKNNAAKKDNPMFAFLPEVIIEHINHSESKEFTTPTKITQNDEMLNVTQSQPIVFDPLADPFDGMNIEIKPSKKKIKKIKKEKIKFTETVSVPKSELVTTTTSENKIIQFVKKLNFNFFNF
jgi:hypothetical protein